MAQMVDGKLAPISTRIRMSSSEDATGGVHSTSRRFSRRVDLQNWFVGFLVATGFQTLKGLRSVRFFAPVPPFFGFAPTHLRRTAHPKKEVPGPDFCQDSAILLLHRPPKSPNHSMDGGFPYIGWPPFSQKTTGHSGRVSSFFLPFLGGLGRGLT